jgi:hypothetical protein
MWQVWFTACTIFEINPDGVVMVRFEEEISAQACVDGGILITGVFLQRFMMESVDPI